MPLITLYNFGEGAWESADFAAYKETGNDAIAMVLCGVMEVEIATSPLAHRSNMPTLIRDKRVGRLVKASKNKRLGSCSKDGSPCKTE
jgi:hypothetical protein